MAQSTSTTWAALWGADGTTQEFAFDIDGTWYGADAEVEHSVDYSLFEEFGIGNASSATLTLSLYADSIPRGATITRYVRLVSEDGETVSVWLPKGTFYINTRSVDDGLWTITAYDAMRRADTIWTPDDDMEFPMSMTDAVGIFCDLMGVELHDRVELDSNYTIDYPTDDYTIRNLLCFIAAAHGGNWIITDDGYLDLVPLTRQDYEADIGLDIVSFEDNGELDAISRVTLLVDDDNYYTAGDDTGMELEATCPYATQAIADAVCDMLTGYQYHAYTAGAANIDPAMELGDWVIVNDIEAVIAIIADDGNGYPDISAPGEKEVDEEYPMTGYVTNQINLVKKQSTEYWSTLSKTAEEITASVESLSGEVSEVSVKVDSISLSVSNGTSSSTISLLMDGVVISSQDITITGFVTFESLSGSGTTTINGDNITTGTISAEYIKLGGKMTVYETTADDAAAGGYIGYMTGSTGSSLETTGIGICDITDTSYLIATEAGIRMTSGSNSFYVTDSRIVANGNMVLNDALTVSGATTLNSTLDVADAVTLSSTLSVSEIVSSVTFDSYVYFAGGTTYYINTIGTAYLRSLHLSGTAYFADGTTYYVSSTGNAKFNTLTTASNLTVNGYIMASGDIYLPNGEGIYGALSTSSSTYFSLVVINSSDQLIIGNKSDGAETFINSNGTLYLNSSERDVVISGGDLSSDWTAGNNFNLCFPTSSTTYGAFVYVNSSGFYLGRSAFATYVYGSSVNVTGSLIVSSTDIYSGLSTSTTEQRLQVRNSYVRGYLYANTSGNLGIYNATLSAVMILQSAAGALTVGNTMYATYIYGTTVTIRASPFTVLGNMRIGSSSNATNYYLYLTNSSYELRLGCTTGGDRGLYDVTNSHWIVQNTSAGASYLGYSGYNTYLRGSTVYSSVSITVSSDRSLKTNIESLPDSYEAMLDAMEPVQFAMTEDESGKLHMGYIANDVLTAAENAGLAESDIAWIMRGDDDLLGLNYSEIIPLLHLKIKKLEARIAQLESA